MKNPGRSFLNFSAFLLVFLNVGWSPALADSLEQVTLQLKWAHQFQFAGYYAAVEQGYYREAGLEVKLVPAAPGEDTVSHVLEGKAEYGVGTSDLLLLKAKNEPVVVLGVIFQHSPQILLARKDAGIDSLHDLVGKKVMMEPQAAELLAYLRNEGVEPDKILWTPHDFNVQRLLNGDVAAMSGYSTDEPYTLAQAGVEGMVFTPRAGGVDFYGDNLFTTEAQIRHHPEQVKAFREASLRGWDYAMKHPEEIVDLIRRKYNPGRSKEQLMFEARQTAMLMHTELIEPGHMYKGRWQHMADTYAEFGMMPAKFDLDDFLYDPDPRPDLSWVYWTLGGLGVCTILALGWVLPLMRLNAGLRREIAGHRRTAEALALARDEAERSSVAKSNFIGFLTHEIRTPLTGTLGLVELIKEYPLNEDQTDNLRLIEESTAGLIHLIGNTLDQQKLEAGRMELDLHVIDLRQKIRDLADFFKGYAQQKSLSVETVFDEKLPLEISCDSMRLRQVISNLVSNAIKFTPASGTVVITVTMSGASMIRFEVTDTGPGVTAEQKQRIFEPYGQGSAGVARSHGGTGLGLPISRQLARMMGGDLWVEEGPGGRFVLEVELGAKA